MPVRDDLGTRMKTFYEQVPKTRLSRRIPVAIRIDVKLFILLLVVLKNLLMKYL